MFGVFLRGGLEFSRIFNPGWSGPRASVSAGGACELLGGMGTWRKWEWAPEPGIELLFRFPLLRPLPWNSSPSRRPRLCPRATPTRKSRI